MTGERKDLDTCDECGGATYRTPREGEKRCDCRERRHALRKTKHAEALGHLKDALDRQGKGGDNMGKVAVLLAGITRAMIATMEGHEPDGY